MKLKLKNNWQTAASVGVLLCGLVPLAGAQQKSSAPDAGSHATTAPAAPPVLEKTIIEEKAMALLKRNQQVMFALKSYAAECHTILTRDKPSAKHPGPKYSFATLTAEKPNKMRYDSWDLENVGSAVRWVKPTTVSSLTFACDGRNNYKQFGKYYRKDARTTPANMSTILEPWCGFYASASSPYGVVQDYQKQNEVREVRLAGQEAVEGIVCDKVIISVISTYGEQRYDNRSTWYFGPDSLVRRCISYVSFDSAPGLTRDATLTNIRLNKPVDTRLYAYKLPAGVTLEPDIKQTPLLANGTMAPDFIAQDIHKKPIKLSELRGKVVVIDFWASWCGPCKAAMPHNQEVMRKLQAQGLPVVMLAVDDGESREAFDVWVKKQSVRLSALTFAYVPSKEDVSGKQFKAIAIPTQYVLDRKGVIRASFVGFDGPNALEKAIRAALANN